MTYFKEALSAPALHFKRLRLAEPLLCNGAIVVRRTHTAIETEIAIGGRRYLLYLPFRSESIRHIEALEAIAQERSRGALIENHILHEELMLRDSLGRKHLFDVVVQELPEGLPLREAINCYRADDLVASLRKMKSRMDATGFCHNNLTPSNIIISHCGSAHPLRYWYAEWELFSDNDISQLLDFVESNRHDRANSSLLPSLVQDCEAEYTATPHNSCGISRVRRGNLYGFIDCDGRQITPFEYSWASEFQEGRAIVAKGSKMGAIDSNGRKVIFVVYNSLEFDVESGFFTATNDRYRYLIDYNGAIVRRTKLEVETPHEANIEV